MCGFMGRREQCEGEGREDLFGRFPADVFEAGGLLAYSGDGIDFRSDRELPELVRAALCFDLGDGGDCAGGGTERVGEREGETEQCGETAGGYPGYIELYDGEECGGVAGTFEKGGGR